MKHIILVQDEVELAQLVRDYLSRRQALKSVCFMMGKKPITVSPSANQPDDFGLDGAAYGWLDHLP